MITGLYMVHHTGRPEKFAIITLHKAVEAHIAKALSILVHFLWAEMNVRLHARGFEPVRKFRKISDVQLFAMLRLLNTLPLVAKRK